MISVTRNGIDITSSIRFPHLSTLQKLTNEVDTASFNIRAIADALLKEDGGFLLQEDGHKLLLNSVPAFDDDVVISDGATVIFAGKVSRLTQTIESPRSSVFSVQCIDHSFEMDRRLASRSYTNMTVAAIIADLITSFAPGFTTTHVSSSFVVAKIVFNNQPLSQCLRQLADLVRYDWYIDENKDVHFFPATTNPAPLSLTDTTGSHVFKSLVRSQDGTQVVNRVVVRGGEYDGATFTDVITVSGSLTSAFNLPYKMANLTIEVDTGGGYVSKTVGIEFIDDIASFDVLYSYQTQSFRFASPLAAGDKIRFTGNPKTPVVAVVEDSASIALYGRIEKLVRDTSILDNTTARKRAAAELLAFTEVAIDAKFKTYTSGLRTGMLISVNAAGYEDQLLIKQVSFVARTPTTFEYDVSCISAQRYSLIDVLRKILEPEPLPTDEREVSETLCVTNERITTTLAPAAYTPTTPVAIVNQTNLSQASTGASFIDTPFDCTGATAIFVVVTTPNVSAMTYGGVALTRDVQQSGGTYNVEIWRLNSPATGTNTLKISAAANVEYYASVLAVSGMTTSGSLIATAQGTAASLHKTLAASQPTPNLTVLALMGVAIATPSSYTPDPMNTEIADAAYPIGGIWRVNVLVRILTLAGTKAMGTSVSSVTGGLYGSEVMALYKGADPRT